MKDLVRAEPFDSECQSGDVRKPGYPRVVMHISGLVSKLPGAALVVDATGVGRPVVDQLRAAGLDPIAVTITAGQEAKGKRETTAAAPRPINVAVPSNGP